MLVFMVEGSVLGLNMVTTMGMVKGLWTLNSSVQVSELNNAA